MKDNFDIDEELKKSIADIIDEEIAEANNYYYDNPEINKQNKEVELIDFGEDEEEEILPSIEEYEEDTEYDDAPEPKDKKPRKIILIVSLVITGCIVIGLVAYMLIKKTIDKSHGYAYYNNLAYEKMDNKDYEAAITNFKKALSFEESKSNAKERADMMFWLYDSYKQTGKTEEGIPYLEEILELDDKNETAYAYLIDYYGTLNKFEELAALFEKAKETGDSKIIELFSRYNGTKVEIYPAAGDYDDDIEVKLTTTDSKAKIYYSLNNGSDQIYVSDIKLGEGNNTLNYYSINEYGIKSDILTAEYNVNYKAPSEPVISPEETDIAGNEKVKVTISGYADNAKVYYTLDGSEPTVSSKEYTGEFELESGTTTVTVLVINERGAKVTATKTYNVTYADKYTADTAEGVIWKKLIEKGLVDSEHKQSSDLCELKYYSKKTISKEPFHLFYFIVDDEIKDYFYGVNSQNGTVYIVTRNGDEYSLSKL